MSPIQRFLCVLTCRILIQRFLWYVYSRHLFPFMDRHVLLSRSRSKLFYFTSVKLHNTNYVQRHENDHQLPEFSAGGSVEIEIDGSPTRPKVPISNNVGKMTIPSYGVVGKMRLIIFFTLMGRLEFSPKIRRPFIDISPMVREQ